MLTHVCSVAGAASVSYYASQSQFAFRVRLVQLHLCYLTATFMALPGNIIRTSGFDVMPKSVFSSAFNNMPNRVFARCVIILTAVVPRQLPMQMAVAVNHSLLSLSRAGLFCTEPYRVPIAGIRLAH